MRLSERKFQKLKAESSSKMKVYEIKLACRSKTIQGKHEMRQSGVKWIGMRWKRLEKNYQKRIIKAKSPNWW